MLKVLCDENNLNKSEKDTEELFSQFLSFHLNDKEFKDIELYKLRLKTLVYLIEHSEDDPQTISKRFHRRVYVAGLRCSPHYAKTIDAIEQLDEQDITYIHNHMKTVCGKNKRIIRQMHARTEGSSTIAAAITTNSDITTVPTLPVPARTNDQPQDPNTQKSHNGKSHLPDCQSYVATRRCPHAWPR